MAPKGFFEYVASWQIFAVFKMVPRNYPATFAISESEILVMGGRDDNFNELSDAYIINTETVTSEVVL